MFKNKEAFKKYLVLMSNQSKMLKTNINELLKLARAINNGLEKPFDNKDVENICVSILNESYPSYCDDKGNVIPFRLAEFLLKKDHYFANGFNLYVYKNGVYTEIENERILYRKIYNLMPLDVNKTTAKGKEVVELMKTLSYDDKQNEQVKSYINVKNGIIDIKNRKLLKHSFKFITTLQFNANYIEENEFDEMFSNSKFKLFLETTLNTESIVTLQECFGLILSPHAKEVQKAFIFLGGGSNGKSTVADIITALVGGNNFMSCLGMADFQNRFDTSGIQGKFLNMNIDDESSLLEKTGKFKSVVAGDVIDIEKKGKDKISYLPNLTCIIGLNKLPATADRSHGFYRRQCIIPFKKTFGTQEEIRMGKAKILKDPKLAEHIITKELDIVLGWALKGLYRVIENNFQLSKNGEAEEQLEEFKTESDSVYAFYKYKLEVSEFESDRIKASILFAEYKKYCEEIGVSPQNGTNFGRELKSFGLKTKRSSDGLYYIGILGFKTNQNINWNEKEH